MPLRKWNFKFFLCALGIWHSIACIETASASQETLSPLSKSLSECEIVHFYAMHQFQIANNLGAARNMLYRATLTSTTNMFLNARGGTVPGTIVRQMKAAGAEKKRQLDMGYVQVIQEIDRCLPIMTSAASAVRNSRRRLWGLDLDELQSQMFERLARSFGL